MCYIFGKAGALKVSNMILRGMSGAARYSEVHFIKRRSNCCNLIFEYSNPFVITLHNDFRVNICSGRLSATNHLEVLEEFCQDNCT